MMNGIAGIPGNETWTRVPRRGNELPGRGMTYLLISRQNDAMRFTATYTRVAPRPSQRTCPRDAANAAVAR